MSRLDPRLAHDDRENELDVPDTSAVRLLAAAHPFDIEAVKQRLQAGTGGYEIVHASPGLEVGVYVLVAPEPDRQEAHADDELYVVLEGTGTLDVAGTRVDLREGHAVFVPAGVEHEFIGYERLSVLVIFERLPR